jgi:ferrous iron transport protein A
MRDKLLTELKKGETAEIIAVDGGLALQQRLSSLGIVQGKTVKKLSTIRMGGPIVLLIDRAQVAIGKGMAQKIVVKIINEDAKI